MSRVFQVEDFTRYNGFYGKPYCRQVVLHLYEGKCVTCSRAIDGEGFHVAHIIARSHPDLMEKYFSGLDVDNLLNLKLSCRRCNLSESNFMLDALLLLHAFNCSARVISSRLESALAKLQTPITTIEISSDDPRICTGLLTISVDEIRNIASDWLGAVVIASADLDIRVREALTNALGEYNEHLCYQTIVEAIGYFHDHLRLNGGSCALVSSGTRPWLVEAYRYLYSQGRGVQSITAARRVTGLIDGVYLDPDELGNRGGLVIPLRTESQRWFHSIFVTLVRMRRKLEASPDGRYLVLGENEWRSLCNCFNSLSLIEPGIGKIGPRLKLVDIVAHFGLCGDELTFGEETLVIPEKVRRMCRTVATDSIWGEGALIRKSKFKPWLARAFSLADQAAQQVTGPHLIRIGDDWDIHWVPPLPRLAGKTRDEVSLETSLRVAHRGRSRRSLNHARGEPAAVTPK